MPPAWGGEDRQPNELRLSRKGATNVPLVRSTAPRWTPRSDASQSYRGRGRGFRGTNRGHGHPVSSHTSAVMGSSQRGRFNSSGRSSAFNTHPGDHRSQYPAVVNSSTADATPQGFSNAQKRVSDFSDPRQAKRPCFDNRSNVQSHATLNPTTALPPSNKAPKKSNQKGPRVEIKLDLPLHCRKGVHGYHKSRRHWLDREIQKVEEDRKVAVHHTEFLDREVRLLCNLQNPLQPSIRDESSTANQEHQELEINAAQNSVDRNLFNPTAMVPEIRIKPHRQMSIAIPAATPATDNNSALLTDIGVTFNEPLNTAEDQECLVTRTKKISYQNTIAQSSTLARPAKVIASTQMTAAGPFTATSTSRTSELSLTPSNDKSCATKNPYSENNHDRSLQHVPRLQRQSSPGSSAELVTQPHFPHLRGFRSGTLTITPSPSVSFSSVQKHHSTRPINDTYPSTRSSSPPRPKPGNQSAQDSDSDSDTPLLSLVSKAKHPAAGSEVNSQLEDRVIASSSNPGIQTATQSRDNSEFSSTSLTLPTRTTDIESARIPQDSHDRTRRILVPSSGSSLINVTSHGFMDTFNLSPLRHRYTIRTPVSPIREQVDDACLFQAFNSTVVILGHARNEHQISLLTLNHDRVRTSISLDRPWNQSKKGGVSALSTMMQPQRFVSGGYDHVVHVWTVKEDFTSSPSQLAIKHAAAVQSLLPIRDTSHKLISASADTNVHIWDFSSERVVNTMKPSNSVFHAHTTSSPYCTLLEVAHRELQFELRDHRFVPELPVQRFGYRSPQFHGRFIKGDLRSNYFASGSRDGSVRLWDMRSLKVPCTTIPCFSSTQKVVQVMFDQPDGYILVTSANNEIACVRYLTGGL